VAFNLPQNFLRNVQKAHTINNTHQYIDLHQDLKLSAGHHWLTPEIMLLRRQRPTWASGS
jgi:hypothetical protein